MAGNIKGITIEFDGDVSKLQKSLKTVTDSAVKINKELKDVNKSLNFNPGNTELIGQKQRKLGDIIEENKKKLELLKQADVDAKKQLESGNLGQENYDKLQREIVQTEGYIKHFQEELRKTNNYKLTKLGKEFTKVGEKIQKAGKKIADAGSWLSTRVTLPLVGVGTAGFKMAAELEDAMGATDAIFKGSSQEVKDWANSLESYYGIAEEEALSYSNIMGSLLQNIGGMTEQEASKMSGSLVELAGDMSAMIGGSTQDAVNTLTQALKGNYETLDNYGMGITRATVTQKALDMGLASTTSEVTLQDRQVAALQLIWEQTADSQGQAAREAEGSSGAIKSLTTSIKNLVTEIGEVLLPVITPLINKLTEWIKKFQELDPETKQFIVKMGLLAAAAGPVLTIVGKLVGGIGSLVKGVGGAITKISSLASSAGTLGAVFSGLGTILLPLIAIIGTLVGAFVSLWNANEEFKNGILEIWEQLKTTFGELVSGIQERLGGLKEAFTNIVNFLTPLWEGFTSILAPLFTGAFQLIADFFDSITGVILGVLDVFIGIFTGDWDLAWEGVKNIFSSTWEFIENTIANVLETIEGIINATLEIIKSIITSAWQFITGDTDATWDSISSTISNTWNNIKNGVTEAVDNVKNTVTGAFDSLKNKVSEIWDNIKTAITEPINSAWETVKDIADRLKNVFNFNWKLPKLKLPHLKIGSKEGAFGLKIPTFSINWYKEGGYFDKPSIIGVGEAGDEVLLPTHKLDKFLEEAVKRVGGSNTNNGFTINIEKMEVRDDTDIDRIARELAILIKRQERGLGNVY